MWVDITPDFDIIAKTNGYVKSISEYVSKKQEQKSAEDTTGFLKVNISFTSSIISPAEYALRLSVLHIA